MRQDAEDGGEAADGGGVAEMAVAAAVAIALICRGSVIPTKVGIQWLDHGLGPGLRRDDGA